MAYSEWQLLHFAPVNLAQSDAENDPNGDGVSNHTAYLLGLSPTGDEPAVFYIGAKPSASADMVDIHLWQRAGTAAAFQASACGDLRTPNWQPATINGTRHGATINTMQETILSVQIPANLTKTIFLRLTIKE
jgi:hypothetical protein